MFSAEQVKQYLAHISFPHVDHSPGSLDYLTELQKRHMAKVPFESLSLHYSKFHLLSLDQQDLFQKIVVRGMGGYCMEVNAFFGAMLRSLGFTLFNTGGRVSNVTGGRPDPGYMGLSHMVNIVTIGDQRYLVDVGFGADGSTHPLPLISEHICPGITPQSLRLEYKRLHGHTDPSQRAWVFSHRADDDAPWVEGYSFLEIEFFPEDYEIMNLSTMILPRSYFTKTVLCMKMILDEETGDTEGVLILYQNFVKKRIRGVTDVIEELKSEEDRVRALEKWFGIVLNEDEKKGIIGLATELRGW